MDNFIFYFIGFLAVVYIARFLGEKGMKHLNPEQKLGLIDLFAKDRKYNSAIVFGLVILFLLALQFHWLSPIIVLSIYFPLFLLYFIAKSYRTYKKLQANQYPQAYIKTILLANAIAMLGILVFFVGVFYDLFAK